MEKKISINNTKGDAIEIKIIYFNPLNEIPEVGPPIQVQKKQSLECQLIDVKEILGITAKETGSKPVLLKRRDIDLRDVKCNDKEYYEIAEYFYPQDPDAKSKRVINVVATEMIDNSNSE